MRQDQKENDQITKAAKHSPPLLVNLTSMPELSPAAQAVLDAGNCARSLIHRLNIAAALRAAADQVVPAPRLPYDSCCDVNAVAIRAELLAIAIELEAQCSDSLPLASP